MNWTVWRLHRNQAIIASGALAAMTAFLLITGVHLAGLYHHALATCGATNTCSDLPGQLFQGDGWLWDLATLTIVLPGLVGVFWGAPLVAKEVEESTHKLAWTQSVPRRRWLGANLGWLLLAAAVWGGAVGALVTWWLGPLNALDMSRFHPGQFDIQGVVPIAYSVFAVSLGIAAGAWFRRVLPAAAATLGGFVLVRFVIADFVRGRLLAPVVGSVPLGKAVGSGPLGASWVLSSRIVDAAGHPVGPVKFGDVPVVCRGATPRSMLDCLGHQGWHVVVSYQPAGRFWTFQGMEAAIFLAIAAMLVAFASWRVLARDA